MDRRPVKGPAKSGRLKWRTVIIPFSTLQFWVNFFIVLAILGTILVGVYYQFLSPKAQARKFITQAEEKFDQAIVLGVKELAYENYRTVQETLFQARKNYDERKYTESLILSEQAMASLEKTLDRLRSDEYFRRERAATFSHLKGDIQVQKAGSLNWDTARKGMKLNKGDRIRTRSGSTCIVQFDDGSQLTVKSDSLVHIDELSEDVRTRTKNSAIKLLVSDVEASILRPTAKGSRFLIETPGSVAQVRKARMNIRVNEKNQTEYSLISGDVSVSAGGRDVRLATGEKIRLAGEGRVMSRGKLLGVPEPRIPPNLDWRVSAEEKFPVTFEWAAVTGANRYHLIVATDRYFTNVVYESSRIQGTRTRIPELRPGMYYWRVSSIDRQGNESLSSRFSVFRLIQDQTPPYFTMSDPIVLDARGGGRTYLAGAVEPGSRLTVNGVPAPLGPDGSFRLFTSYSGEMSSLDIEAVDSAGNVLIQRRVIQ
jgi:ferric-dicitrate binding protein FerR (iron transport regulator)